MDSVVVAPILIGWEILRHTSVGEVRLKIVETEAYHQADPASHSYRGLSARTAPMFDVAGTIYVYFIYGMHYVVNIVTGPKGDGQAVLLRAAEPVSGTNIMKSNRGLAEMIKLANGPGKLAQALGIKDTKLSGQQLNKKSLQLLPAKTVVLPEEIKTSRRIGISKGADRPWRFYLKDSPFVSRYNN